MSEVIRFNQLNQPFVGLTGRVDFMCIGVSSGLAFIQDNKLLPLAVCTPKRSAALPKCSSSATVTK